MGTNNSIFTFFPRLVPKPQNRRYRDCLKRKLAFLHQKLHSVLARNTYPLYYFPPQTTNFYKCNSALSTNNNTLFLLYVRWGLPPKGQKSKLFTCLERDIFSVVVKVTQTSRGTNQYMVATRNGSIRCWKPQIDFVLRYT